MPIIGSNFAPRFCDSVSVSESVIVIVIGE
jgi:hypothetical protein